MSDLDAIKEKITDLLEGQIDFQGQKLSENISNVLLTITSIVALAVGFVQRDIYLTLWIGLAGTLLTMLIVVPPWPVFNRNPQPWIGSDLALSRGVVVGGGKGS